MPHFLGYPAADALFNLQLSVVPGSFLNYFRYSWVADDKRMTTRMGFFPQFTSRGALLAFYDSLAPQRPTAPEVAP